MTGKKHSLNRRNLETNPLLEQFSEYLLKIDDALKRELDLYSWSEFYAPLRYACEGGKRIRPRILVLSAESVMAPKVDFSRIDEDVFFAACAIELLHTESVIHDDIIDEENLRRGKPSFHVKYGYNSSILTADFVLGVILNIGSKLNNSRVASELSNAAIKMSEGEIMEIKLAEALKFGEDDEIHAMATFGNFLGIAYQIHDDLIDWNNEERLFNILVKNNDQSKEFVDRMEKLYLSYSSKAKKELVKINDSIQKRHLEHLTDLASVQF